MQESRRERKKQQTRQLLMETAIRLFSEQGYEQTTVAQIAAAADVATKTFFNHFQSKDEVLFTANRERSALALEVIADRQPGESVADLLTRTYNAMLADYLAKDADGRERALMETYVQLVMSAPALQAKALHVAFDVQRDIAAALLAAYPDELDAVSAAAVVGATWGAALGASLTSMERGDPEEKFWAAMRRGIDIALHGLEANRPNAR
ncbi:TetR/AcrR family transcriptional regulator [Marinitenerispora sediminis]|uniref:TetR family transcriptional regulator n=1 Tax=Marinitenerispora sediminis TaxID=1931232 RepID=A0A368T4R2_9ACTN|nr:TetR family transcriptional regulator [Marinitenerispora sediminis]RCV50016.1 TetR family transcriptional regulator [Marinitenerispora sediminis]RCV54060.1 TetR family transcriptional regulator [Marinitenerispora sediminis]RCV58561.1 TetR family transcriptional regulator [Marinitenerispora sediminis]